MYPKPSSQQKPAAALAFTTIDSRTMAKQEPWQPQPAASKQRNYRQLQQEPHQKQGMALSLTT
jgi:hypothetical protein